MLPLLSLLSFFWSECVQVRTRKARNTDTFCTASAIDFSVSINDEYFKRRNCRAQKVLRSFNVTQHFVRLARHSLRAAFSFSVTARL